LAPERDRKEKVNGKIAMTTSEIEPANPPTCGTAFSQTYFTLAKTLFKKFEYFDGGNLILIVAN